MNPRRTAIGLGLLAVGLTLVNMALALLRFSIQTGHGIPQTVDVPFSLLRLAAYDRLFYPVTYTRLAAVAACSVGAVALAINESSRSMRQR